MQVRGVYCPGRGLCNNEFCPICKPAYMFKSVNIRKKEFFGSSPPSIFIGSKLVYPSMNVGILSPTQHVEDAWLFGSQRYWANNNYNIKQILSLRSRLVNSRFQTTARAGSKFLEASQEIGMAIKPVDVEINLKKEITLKLDFENVTLPQGPRGELEKVRITENPKIPTKIDKVVSDTDLKAKDALEYLYKNDFDDQFLTQLLSIGVLGLKKNRKLVPTRWSITASDDTIGKFLIEKIKDYKTIDDYTLFVGSYLGNYYFIMMFPDMFSYELFELYLPRSVWNPESNQMKVCTDHESFHGRKSYVNETAGGYYASRLPIVEHLDKMKRQGSVLVIRFETPEYYASLGVFVVREACRKTMDNLCINFESKEQMLDYVKNEILKMFSYDINEVYSKSIMLNQYLKQKRLKDYF